MTRIDFAVFEKMERSKIMELGRQAVPSTLRQKWKKKIEKQPCCGEETELCSCKIRKLKLVLEAFQHAFSSKRRVIVDKILGSDVLEKNNNIVKRKKSIKGTIAPCVNKSIPKEEVPDTDLSSPIIHRPKLDPDTERCFRRTLIVSVGILTFLVFVLAYSIEQRLR